MTTARTTILLDADLLDRLDRHVRRQRATKTSVITMAVEAWLDSHEATPEFPFLGIGRSAHGRLSLDGRAIARREAGGTSGEHGSR
jgi:predicted transcriptional regulator